MAGIILDTNVISELMKFQPDDVVLGWFARQTTAIFYTTAVTKAEILSGIALLDAGKRRDALRDAVEKMFQDDFNGRCLPFDEGAAVCYASILANRRRSGFTITTEDVQIAAIALCRNMPIATRNTRDFLHIEGLTLYNPFQ